MFDLGLILVFAILGRASHTEALDLAGIWHTAWPFLVAGLVGSGIAWGVTRWSWLVEGIIAWLVTVVGGMLLRIANGDTAAPAFIMVATFTLALFLIGWRYVAHRLARRRTPTP